MQYATAFREYDADDVSEWTPGWAAVAGSNLALYQNWMAAEQWLEASVSSGTRKCWLWSVISGDANRADVRMLALLHTGTRFGGSSVDGCVLLARQSGTATSSTQNAYMVELVPSATEIRLAKMISGTRTQLDAAAPSGRQQHGELVWLRFEVHGTAGSAVQRARCWPYGTTEPTAWDVEAADTALSAAGGVGVAGTACVAVHRLFVGTGTDEPIAPGVFGRSLEELRSARGVKLEWTLELDTRDPDTDTEETIWLSSRGRSETRATDLPVSESLPALLEPPDQLVTTLAGDLEFKRDAARSVTVELRNKPRSRTAAGPLDALLSRSVAGRNAVLRVGEAGAWLRSFTRMFAGRVALEPQPRGDRIAIEIESALGRALAEPLDVRRYFGIRTCLRSLSTSNNQGLVTVPSDTAYDTASFSWFARFRSPTYTGSGIVLADRYTDANNQQFDARMLNGGAIRFRSLDTAVEAFSFTSPLTYDDDRWHWAFGAVQDGFDAFLVVDGALIERDVPGTIHVATGQPIRIREGSAAVGFCVCDVRFYDEYIPVDLARSLAAARVAGDSHDALVAMLPLDDGAGTTATDYSPTANDGAVAGGTEDVDWEWSATDQGEPSLAGQPMPLAYGVGKGFPMQEIDLVRERFRVHDGDLPATAGFSAGNPVVRARGQALDFSTDYTDEGDGVMEVAATQDEPVTADVPALNDANEPNAYVGNLTTAILGERAPSIVVDTREFAGAVPTWQAAWHSMSRPGVTAAVVLQELLANAGAAWFEDRWGRIAGSALVPPLGPGPDAEPAWLECRGGSANHTDGGGIRLDGLPSLTGANDSHTLALYYRPTALPLASVSSGVYTLLQYGGWLRLDPLDGAVLYGPEGGAAVLRAPGLTPGRTYFIRGSYDDGSGTANLTIHDMATPEVAAVSVAASGQNWSYTTSPHDLYCGFAPGGYQWAMAWLDSVPLTPTLYPENYFGDMALALSEGIAGFSLLACLPFTEGSGMFAREAVNGGRAALGEGMRWCPRLVLDLREANSAVAWRQPPRVQRPVRRLTVRYGRRFRPLTPTEIVGSVLADDQASTPPNVTTWYTTLQREWQHIDADDPDVAADYALTRDISIDSPLVLEQAAQRLLRHLKWRYQPGRTVAELAIPDHRWLGLVPTDEVRVHDYRYGLSEGRHFRLVAAGSPALMWG